MQFSLVCPHLSIFPPACTFAPPHEAEKETAQYNQIYDVHVVQDMKDESGEKCIPPVSQHNARLHVSIVTTTEWKCIIVFFFLYTKNEISFFCIPFCIHVLFLQPQKCDTGISTQEKNIVLCHILTVYSGFIPHAATKKKLVDDGGECRRRETWLR